MHPRLLKEIEKPQRLSVPIIGNRRQLTEFFSCLYSVASATGCDFELGVKSFYSNAPDLTREFKLEGVRALVDLIFSEKPGLTDNLHRVFELQVVATQRFIDVLKQDPIYIRTKTITPQKAMTATVNGVKLAHIAAWGGHVDELKQLAEFKKLDGTRLVDFNETNNDGNTIAHYAMFREQLSSMQFLASLSDADGSPAVDFNKQNKSGESSFFYVSRKPTQKFIQFFFSLKLPNGDFRIDFNRANLSGVNFFAMIVNANNLKILKLILSLKKPSGELLINIHQTLANGWNAVHLAAKNNSIETLKELATLRSLDDEYLMNFDLQDQMGGTPIMSALENHALESFDFLWDLRTKDNKPLLDLSKRRQDGMTLAHIAARQGKVDIIKKLRDRGIDIYVGTPTTPFDVAQSAGQMKVIEYYEKLQQDAKIRPQTRASQPLPPQLIQALPTLPDHDRIIAVAEALGHTGLEKGVCEAFRELACRALYVEDYENFINRLYFINTYHASIPRLVEEKDEKIHELGIVDFYDLIAKLQKGVKHNASGRLVTVESFIYEKAGGLATHLSMPVIGNRKQLLKFFTVVDKIARSSQCTFDLRFDNEEHAIGLFFSPGTGWVFIDVAQEELLIQRDFDVKFIVDKIFKAFEGISLKYDPYRLLGMQVRALNGNQQDVKRKFIDLLQENLIFARMKEVTPKKAVIKTLAGQSLAHVAARLGCTEVIQQLAIFTKKNGDPLVDFNEQDAKGRTVVWECLYSNFFNLSTLKFLLSLRSQAGNFLVYFKPDIRGLLPVCLAAANDNVGLIKHLLSYKMPNGEFRFDIMQTDFMGRNLFLLSVRYHYIAVLKYILTLKKPSGELLFNVNCTLEDGVNAAYLAAQRNDVEILKELAALRKPDGSYLVDFNLQDNDGRTPIMGAVESGSIDAFYFLFNLRANENKHLVDLAKRRKDGMTLAHIAAKRGFLEILKELRERGVDIYLGTPRTPWDVAKSEGHAEIVEYYESLEKMAIRKRRRTRMPAAPSSRLFQPQGVKNSNYERNEAASAVKRQRQ